MRQIKTITLLVLTFWSAIGIAQIAESDELFKQLKSLDSLLFEVGFNHCDLAPFEDLLHSDTEFYHDQSGVSRSKTTFIENLKNGLCTMENRPRRELVPGSLEVFLMKDRGETYGALQRGLHKFYLRPDGGEEVLTSTARFTHLWILDHNEWKLSRVISYDHLAP